MNFQPDSAPWRIEASIPESGFEYYELQSLNKDGHWITIADIHGPHVTRRLSSAVLISQAPALLLACQCALAAAERIVEQYGAVQCGVDFYALETTLTAAIKSATTIPPKAEDPNHDH